MRTWLAAAAFAAAVAGSAAAQAPGTATLRIRSTPSAAEVELIGGLAGMTPLAIHERAIYPNDYPDARADLYGVVVLSHPGCEPLRHRVTRGDLERGLDLHLACDAAVAPPTIAAAQPGAQPAAPVAPTGHATVPQRRLRQLQVLQELLDEGLITPAEEQRVRRRILEGNPGPGD